MTEEATKEKKKKQIQSLIDDLKLLDSSLDHYEYEFTKR